MSGGRFCDIQRLPTLQRQRASLSYPAFAHTTERWPRIAFLPSVCSHYRVMGVHRFPIQRLPTLQNDGRALLSYPAFARTTERWACIAVLPSVCPHYRAMGVHRFPTQRLPTLQSDGRASRSNPAFSVFSVSVRFYKKNKIQ